MANKEAPNNAKSCIIKSSVKIYTALWKRINDRGLSYQDIVDDAQEHGRKFTVASLSKYKNQFDNKGFVEYKPGSLSQEDIIWLCLRYNIGLGLTVNVEPYDEKEAMYQLKQYFHE